MKEVAIREKLRGIVREQFGVTDFKDSDHVETALEADSLDIVELVMATEEEFNVDIPDEDAENLMTVDKMTTYLEGRV